MSLSMLNKYLIGVFFAVCLLMTACATQSLTPVKPPLGLGSCAAPSEQALRCLGEWACRHAIRLDLRCLLNLNGTPLLGGLLGGTGLIPGAGGGGGAGGGAGTGILGGLLGR